MLWIWSIFNFFKMNSSRRKNCYVLLKNPHTDGTLIQIVQSICLFVCLCVCVCERERERERERKREREREMMHWKNIHDIFCLCSVFDKFMAKSRNLKGFVYKNLSEFRRKSRNVFFWVPCFKHIPHLSVWINLDICWVVSHENKVHINIIF